MSQIRGRYPGGPSRRTDPDAVPLQRGKVHLATVEEIEARAAAKSQQRRQNTRRRQIDRLIDEMWKSEALEKKPGIR